MPVSNAELSSHIEILRDTNFLRGFEIGHWDGLIERGPIGLWGANEEITPSWRIEQWGSRFNLAAGEQADRTIADGGKSVEHIGQGRLRLTIDGPAEMRDQRRAGESWPHLLLEQFFDGIPLSDFSSLDMAVHVSFDDFANLMGENIIEIEHTCQLVWYLAIADSTGDFFWYGLALADYPRYSVIPDYMAQDGGKDENTGKFIHLRGSEHHLPRPLAPGRSATIDVEVLRDIYRTFDVCQSRGYMQHSRREDLRIISTNFGFEVTGAFTAAVSVAELSLRGQKGGA